MAVMTNKHELNCTLNYLKEIKATTRGHAVKWIDIAIEAVEKDIKEFDFTHEIVICPQCGYYLIRDLVKEDEK